MSVGDWVGCGGASGAIDSSRMAVRFEVALCGKRPSSGPRAIIMVVEVLQMQRRTNMSTHRSGGGRRIQYRFECGSEFYGGRARRRQQGGESRAWAARRTSRGRSLGRMRRPSASVENGGFNRRAGPGWPNWEVGTQRPGKDNMATKLNRVYAESE